MKRTWPAVLCFFWITAAQAQISSSGRVTDAATGEPLAGANVVCKGTDTGVTTDEEGRFRLSCPTDSLSVSFTGYRTRVINGGDDLAIGLESGIPLLDEGLIVSATALPIQLDIPAPLNRLHPADLRRDDQFAITPALNRISGVFMHSGALNTNRLTIRGVGNRSAFGTAKIRAYLDDIPLTSGVGETTIEDIDLSLLQGVDIWKGPTGSTYGAGLGGLIHLRTADLRQAAPSFAQWHTSLGAYGRRRNVGQFHYLQPGRLSWDLNVNETRSDGYRANNEYRRLGMAALGKISTSSRHQTSLLVNYADLRAQIPSSINQEDFENRPRKAADNWAAVQGFEDNEKLLIGISNRSDLWQADRGDRLSNTTSLFGKYRTNYEVRPFNILRENSLVLGLRSHFDYRRRAADRLPTLSLGMEAFRERYDWQTNAVTPTGGLDILLSDNLEYRRYLNLFAEANLQPGDRWRLVLGLNFNTTGYELTDRFPAGSADLSGSYSYDPILSPRTGLSYDLTDRSLLFATVSRGFSVPTLEETLTPEGARNPDIRPETGWNYELGWRGENVWDQLSFELTLYSLHITDLLVARRTALDQYIGANAGKTMHNGLEAFLSWRPLPTAQDLNLWVSYTWADYQFREFVDREDNFTGNDLTGTAPHLLNAGLDFQWKGWYGNANYQYVAAMPINDANTVYSDPYQLVNLQIGYLRSFPGQRLTADLYAGINNLLGEKYAAMLLVNATGFGGAAPRYYYPGLPRNAYAGLRIQYRLEKE